MGVWSILALAAALALGADVSGLLPSNAPAEVPVDTSALSTPAPRPAVPQTAAAAAAGHGADQPAQPSKTLQPESRLLLVRYVDGEFAKLMLSMPGGKKGFKIAVGKPVDPQHLSDMLRLYGTAASQGDTVQITDVQFTSNEVLVQINGGGKHHFHLRDHLQVGVGGTSSTPTTITPDVPGGTIVLDYGHPLPDMSPDDLKRDLSVMLDFSKEHSPTVNWVDSLPPQFQQAIKDQRAIVGMNEEMVIAAIGRPDHKVRERDADGYDTEDWIYGSPPAPTTFVTFAGDTVVKVKEFD